MENKYFVPEISDLYVGYECQKFDYFCGEYDSPPSFSGPPEGISMKKLIKILIEDSIKEERDSFKHRHGKWVDCTLTKEDLSYHLDSEDDYKHIGKIRTPFLNRDRLIKEGWKESFYGYSGYPCPYPKDDECRNLPKIREYFTETPLYKQGFFLDYCEDNNMLMLRHRYSHKHSWIKFHGMIRCINELRRVWKNLQVSYGQYPLNWEEHLNKKDDGE